MCYGHMGVFDDPVITQLSWCVYDEVGLLQKHSSIEAYKAYSGGSLPFGDVECLN